MTILFFLFSAGILLYVVSEVVSLLRLWYRDVEETISGGELRHETPGEIALDVAKEQAIGAAKIAAGLAVGEALGAVAGGSAGAAGGGAFGGGGAAGSW